jgi:hypothetical protein
VLTRSKAGDGRRRGWARCLYAQFQRPTAAEVHNVVRKKWMCELQGPVQDDVRTGASSDVDMKRCTEKLHVELGVVIRCSDSGGINYDAQSTHQVRKPFRQCPWATPTAANAAAE